MTLTASDIVANAHDATAGIIPLQLSPYGCHQFYIGHHNSEWHSAVSICHLYRYNSLIYLICWYNTINALITAFMSDKDFFEQESVVKIVIISLCF